MLYLAARVRGLAVTKRACSSSSSCRRTLFNVGCHRQFSSTPHKKFRAPSAMSRYLAEEHTPYSFLAAKPYFDSLTAREKNYAHYMARASFEGTRIIIRQTNPDAEGIYDLILQVFGDGTGNNMADIEQLAAKSGVSSEAFNQFLEYSAQFIGNLSNYKSFGDEKFIPRIPAADVEKIIAASARPDEALALFNKVKDEIYSIEPVERNLLGFPDEGHLSGYYSQDMTKEDIRLVQEYLEQTKIEPVNTRLFKTPTGYRLAIASAEVYDSQEHILANGATLEVTFGDFQQEMKKISENIRLAADFVANEHQAEMLESYYESFTSGSIEAHMESQRHWLKDIGPEVETNIGFVETYRDPQAVRAEWSGFVSMVNKEQTVKFTNLVTQAPDFISTLPWPASFERETINKPDFTSLEVLAFATGGVPSGINIPNYSNITQVLGSKNVSLGNVISAESPGEKFPFISADDLPLYRKYRNLSFEVQVGTHELGHGTGKVFTQEDDEGSLNFVPEDTIHPLTNKPVDSWYKPGQTFHSLFRAIANSYEECRAECIALVLSKEKTILDIFGFQGQDGEDILYIMYLNMARSGLLALEYYNPAAKKWGQAHMQARYAILNVLLEAGQGFVTIERTGDWGLTINMDRSKIRTVGAPAVADFLAKLQIYKATADVDEGTKFYLEATSVPESWSEIRDIVVRSKQPRKIFVQANTFINEDGEVVLKEYEPSAVGMIQSAIERRV
ncbi:peptidase family M49-domain-containing protein [Dichotomocladium elegans]|nr:peptidase family M49-domain-containing protein [Dichotomocladium elegans]